MEPIYQYSGTVTEVYDGDTITVKLDLGFHIHLADIKIRLLGINAPEVRGNQKSKGIAVRDRLRARILGKKVVVWTVSKDGFGRWLAMIYDDKGSINRWLLDMDDVLVYT